MLITRIVNRHSFKQCGIQIGIIGEFAFIELGMNTRLDLTLKESSGGNNDVKAGVASH